MINTSNYMDGLDGIGQRAVSSSQDSGELPWTPPGRLSPWTPPRASRLRRDW